MGSLWRSKDIPEHITKSLLDLFGSLKETVIWKYEDKLINAPKNVHVVPWAPQQSILCKLSINFINDVVRNSTNSKYNSGYPKSFKSLGDSPVVQKNKFYDILDWTGIPRTAELFNLAKKYLSDGQPLQVVNVVGIRRRRDFLSERITKDAQKRLVKI